MYLDISHQPEAFLREHFPTIHARCLEFGIDIAKEPIPSCRPHTTCGGVVSPGAPISRACMRSAKRRTRGPRREPAREQLAARMPVIARGGEAIEAAGFDAETPATLPRGTKAVCRMRTRKSSLRTTGTSCAA